MGQKDFEMNNGFNMLNALSDYTKASVLLESEISFIIVEQAYICYSPNLIFNNSIFANSYYKLNSLGVNIFSAIIFWYSDIKASYEPYKLTKTDVKSFSYLFCSSSDES